MSNGAFILFSDRQLWMKFFSLLILFQISVFLLISLIGIEDTIKAFLMFVMIYIILKFMFIIYRVNNES